LGERLLGDKSAEAAGRAGDEPGFHGMPPSRPKRRPIRRRAFIYAIGFAEIIALILVSLLNIFQECEMSARRISVRSSPSPGIATFDARPRRWAAPPRRSATHCVHWRRGWTSGW